MTDWVHRTIEKAMRATSYILILKGAVVGSVALLALFGVGVPHISEALGYGPTHAPQGIAAIVGGVIGAIVAARA